MKMMDKRIMVSLPSELYLLIEKIAQSEFMSISAFIREAIKERIEDSFTNEERALIEKGQKEFRAGEGVNFRKVKREYD